MTGAGLRDIGPGFADAALSSQTVFRAALEAFSRPGRILRLTPDAAVPAGVHPAACALMLALLDQDTALWLSPGVAGAAAYLRFHTGCPAARDPAAAQFGLCEAGELPSLEAFARGSDEYPDRSATVVVQVDALSDAGGWQLRGPGIKSAARIAAGGLGDGFLAAWTRNGAQYPRGVDIYLACGELLCGLPRTTRIEA